MRSASCTQCKQTLSVDEVALNQRLLGMQIAGFFCTDCLAQTLHTTPSHLRTLTARFKELGCVYFTRLMEEASNENEHDGL